ncbi:MAG TPA: ornithine carbamoyltransferase [Anaerolineae bacterium]|nr:ornithine carbamoyltransferase [Anaerolineae bacterium]
MRKDFLAIADYSGEQITEMLNLAIQLKKEFLSQGNKPILEGKVLAMLFNKPSLRTRISFDMAMRHLGGDALFISPDEIGLGKRESIADVARVLSGYVQVIMARVFNHKHIIELAKWANIPVINGLSDYNHPCQAMADLLTIFEHFGKLKNINITYVGDGNNVALSLMHAAAKVGAHFSIASPKGYDLSEKAIDIGTSFARKSGSRLQFLQNPHEAIKDADVIYTDTWTSMGQEQEAKKREDIFPPFQVNSKLLKEANQGAIVMHCLPAHRGQEITDEVADGPQSKIFQQAHNRLHAQKAILVQLLTKD